MLTWIFFSSLHTSRTSPNDLARNRKAAKPRSSNLSQLLREPLPPLQNGSFCEKNFQNQLLFIYTWLLFSASRQVTPPPPPTIVGQNYRGPRKHSWQHLIRRPWKGEAGEAQRHNKENRKFARRKIAAAFPRRLGEAQPCEPSSPARHLFCLLFLFFSFLRCRCAAQSFTFITGSDASFPPSRWPCLFLSRVSRCP